MKIRLKNLQVLSYLLGLIVLVFNFHYSILSGKSLEFLVGVANQGGSFPLDIPFIELALVVSVAVVYANLRSTGWCAITIYFFLVALFLTIIKFGGFLSNYGLSKLAIAVAVASTIGGVAWLVLHVNNLNHNGSSFYRLLLFLPLVMVPLAHIGGKFNRHASVFGLVEIQPKAAAVERAWFNNLVNTRSGSAPELCIFFELSEPLDNGLESYLCTKWSSAQNGNLNPTSMDWAQAILNGDRSVGRLSNIKDYLELKGILVAVDNKLLASASVDSLVIVARNSTQLVEVK